MRLFWRKRREQEVLKKTKKISDKIKTSTETDEKEKDEEERQARILKEQQTIDKKTRTKKHILAILTATEENIPVIKYDSSDQEKEKAKETAGALLRSLSSLQWKSEVAANGLESRVTILKWELAGIIQNY